MIPTNNISGPINQSTFLATFGGFWAAENAHKGPKYISFLNVTMYLAHYFGFLRKVTLISKGRPDNCAPGHDVGNLENCNLI